MTSQTTVPVADESNRLLAGNAPLTLDDPSLAWSVESGEADVFCVEIEASGALGRRHYLFSVKTGDLLFGIQPTSSGRPVALVAVGLANSSVHRVPVADVRAGMANPANAKTVLDSVEAWVRGMCRPRHGEAYYHAAVDLNAGASVSLTRGQTAGPLDGIVWVKELTGSARYLGAANALVPTGVPLPLADPAWIEADDSCQIDVATEALSPADEDFWQSLDAFNRMVLAHEQQHLDLMAARDAQGLEQAAVHEQATRETAFQSLSAVIDVTAAPAQTETHDLLFAACQAVAGAMHVDIRRPPAVEGAPPPSDPLGAIAKASRIRTRSVALQGEWWRREAGPMLGFWAGQQPQPVALLPARGGYNVVDPKANTRQPLDGRLRSQLAGTAIVFYRPFAERALGGWDLVRFGLQGLRGDLTRVVGLGVVIGIIATFTPIVTGVIFGSIIPASDHRRLVAIAFALIGAAVGSSLFQVAQGLAVVRIEARLDSSLESAVWDRLLTLPVPFFRDFSAGDLTNRAMGIDQIRQILEGAAISSILSAVFSLTSVVLMFYYSATLALIGVGLTLISLAATALACAVELKYVRRLTTLQGEIAGSLLQFITGIAKLRVAAAETRAFSAWATAFAEQKRLFFRSRNIGNALTTFSAAWLVLIYLVVFAVIASLPQGSLSTAAYLAFMAAFTGQLLISVLTLSQAATSVLQCVPLYERSLPILQTLPEVTEAKADPGLLSGAIEVSHVSFRYEAGGPPVLQDVSMRTQPGEFVAIVGPSGAGKSSIFRLLLGFETPESGTIYFDGRDLGGLDASAVRRQIGVVLQDARIMPGTIFENIVGTARLTMDDAWEAARLAGLDQDIKQMPMQMHTYISEGGATFSGGQRQRLMIARALVGKPRILLFDEATSALDNVTQAIVTESMAKLKATRVVIAHRLTTVQNADQIVVLEAGRVVQTGDYASLIAQPGTFADLARRQLT